MLSQELRRKFIQYFKEKGHSVVPSCPVAPLDDPTLLFINAGMNQFKDVFLGKALRDYTKACSSQKCIRVGGKHNDLENVGHTTRHLTFFEMLGNFSFGDYFKKEAIDYAWEVTTKVFELDPEKIWVSVYKADDEAFCLWQKYLPTKRIVKLGDEDNFWSMGQTGPCGPCSELLYDRGEEFSLAKDPYEDKDGERFFEFWNLVFMESNRDEKGILTPLPNKNIDTGVGLERIAALKIGAKTLFQTDVLQALIKDVERISGKKYEDNPPPFHVIADHVRCLCFAIADGVQPSNIERGYVLRKVLRRAVRYARSLGIMKPFLSKLVPTLIRCMGEDFSELKAAALRIEEVLQTEEEAFIRTLARGGNIFSMVLQKAKKENTGISGQDAFKLKDTYGFPIEEIELIAKDEDLSIDLETFEKLELEAKEKSKKAHKQHEQTLDSSMFDDKTPTTEFVGYDKLDINTKIIGIIKDNCFVDSLKEGETAIILVEKTPFYAEMGGQAGDTGTFKGKDFLFTVESCTSPYTKVYAHMGSLTKGLLKVGDATTAQVEEKRRKNIENNHTATHILHFALEKVLGSHIKQAGSLVEDTRLRFDFNHHKQVTKEEILEIESIMNEEIRKNYPVSCYEIPYIEAQKKTDIKQFFGDKYGNAVRVVDIGTSKELCGGTHTTSLGAIGFAKITKESSIAAGVRRIEMVTGKKAEEYCDQKQDLIDQICDLLKTNEAKLLERVFSYTQENKQLSLEIKKLKAKQVEEILASILDRVEKIEDTPLLALNTTIDAKELNGFAEKIIKQIPSCILAIATTIEDRCQFLIKVSKDLVEKGYSAKEMIKEISPIIQGGGGGNKLSAQAGGKDPSKITQAIEALKSYIQSHG